MEEPSQLKRAIIDSSAGAISGGISRTVTSPLDVIKIRFQVCFYFLPCSLFHSCYVHVINIHNYRFNLNQHRHGLYCKKIWSPPRLRNILVCFKLPKIFLEKKA